MWMAWDNYRRNKRGEQIEVDFITGMPTMFSVKKCVRFLTDELVSDTHSC